MITAILPMCIKQNPFWLSSKGLECLEHFLKLCKQVAEIEKFIIITQDEAVCGLAKKYNMEINKTFIHDSSNRQYTFKQTLLLARHFKNHYKKKTDALLILDHRNLFLTADDIIKAISLYKQNPESGVISLAFCWDYPCQYKSFYNFIDCLIFNFDEENKMDEVLKPSPLRISKDIICKFKSYGKINISVSIQSQQYRISFSSNNQNHKDYVAQIIPFDSNGPQYKQSQEIYVSTHKYEKLLEINIAKTTGIILILTMPSQSGEYDTIEIFTPQNAPWVLSEKGTSVVDTKNHKSMFGRQQFPPVYTYDGSISILGQKQLEEKVVNSFIPLILNESIIVTDWIDFFNKSTF